MSPCWYAFPCSTLPLAYDSLLSGGRTLKTEGLSWLVWPTTPGRGPTPEMLRRLEFVCQWPMYGTAETRVGIGRSDFPALYFQPSSAMAAALPGWAQKA